MSGGTFRLGLRRDDFALSFTGYVDSPEMERRIAEMVAAMTEGLEANGYEVTATMTVETRLNLIGEGHG